MAKLAALVLLVAGVAGVDHARMLYPDSMIQLNSAKFGADPAAKGELQELSTYSDWHEVYIRWSLRELNGTTPHKASFRLYTTRSEGPIHMYVQHLNNSAWANESAGTDLIWESRPRYGPVISSFKSYTKMSNVIDVSEQIQAMLGRPEEDQYFAIRLFQDGQTMVPFGASGTWQSFAGMANDDYHTRPWLEVSIDCATGSCVGSDDDHNHDQQYEGVDGGPNGTPMEA